MTILLITVFLIGWTAAALIGTQAYFLGEQTKPIHERNLKSESFAQLSKSLTGRDINYAERIPALAIDTYSSSNLPQA